MSDNLTRRIDAIIVECVRAPAFDTVPAHGVGAASSRIASLIAEERGRAFSEGQAVANGERRMCVNCGKTVPADRVKPGDVLTECIGPHGLAACTFDTTPEETWRYWKTCHDEMRDAVAFTRATARAAARREALEEAAGIAETRHARWHDRDFEHEVCCDVTACADIAAAIRALAKKETTDGH